MTIDRCPLTILEWDWPDSPDAEKMVPLPARPCDAELHLVWTYDIPIEWAVAPIEWAAAATAANTDAWEVVCENGHTLARSSAQENAEPFIAELVLGSIKRLFGGD